MLKRLLAPIAALSALTFVLPAASQAPTIQYTVSGVGGGTFSVDDGLTIFDNGNVVFTDGDAGSTLTHPPVMFMGQQGDSITDQVNNTFGFCTGLDPLYLSCPGASAPVLVDPGLVEHCGQPGGNQGISYTFTYTLPAIPGCGPTPIAAVEFTQVIQQYQLLADLKTSLSDNDEPPVPIVSNKWAAMRVYFASVSSVTTYNVQVTGAVNGSKTIDMVPDCSPLQQRGRQDPCYSMDFYFLPPSGAWTATLTVTDNMGNQLEQETLGITSRDTYGISLKGVSGCATGAVTACGDVTQLLGATALTAELWPTSSVTPVVTPEKVTLNAPTVLTGAQLPNFIATMLPKVNSLYSIEDAYNDAVGGTRTAYAAIYPLAIGGAGAIAALPGHGLVIGEADSTDITPQPDYLAHEFGHTIYERHTNNALPVVPAPNTPPGCYDKAKDPMTTWPFLDNTIQSGVAAPQLPTYEEGFYPATQQVENPLSNFDIMAYCVPDWIAPINYKLAFNLLGGGSVASPSLRRKASEAIGAAKPLVQPAPVVGTYWQVGGSIGSGGATLNPVFTQTIQGSTDPGSGTYEIEELSSTGQVLYTRYFTPTAVEPDPFSTSTVVVPVDPIFSEWIPATAGTASIAVLDPNGNVLATLPFTGVAPKVTITSPLAGFVGTGDQTVSWTVQDPNATTFTSRIFYSTNGGTTWQQIDELTATSDIIDFTQMPGATAAIFRIDVSDGVNTGSATSVPFSVPKKAPSTILIYTPISGAVQAAADPVYLSGAAYDADDGVLTGSALAWSDNAQGALGSGSPLIVSLNPGSHTITLTATDSDGNAITATTNITMGGARPIVTVTTNTLAANCVSATISATPGSGGAALSKVQYSLNNGTSYTSIPLGQLPFSFVVPGNSTTTLIARALDLSLQTAAQSAQISLTGACTTGVPSLSGGSAQFATVGAAFANPLAALVSDSNGNPVSGVAVNFAAPATGASATLSAATATTAANGIASVTATANSTSGAYNVAATVPGFSTTAQFALTNTDFTLALQNPSLVVMHGSSGAETVTITPLSGFSSAISLACTGLPDGVTCSFSPANLTPAGNPLTSTLIIAAADNASAPPSATAFRRGLPGGGFVLAFCLLGAVMRGRRRFLNIVTLLVLAAIFFSTTGCGGKFDPFTSTVTVTATSGTLQHTSSIDLSVK